ncbi:MAG TPA: hypothetical protein DCX10_04000 [Verrucomicrobiales bacterium]|nr:hypothetical protein [Verrucomicrobiales bacterium]
MPQSVIESYFILQTDFACLLGPQCHQSFIFLHCRIAIFHGFGEMEIQRELNIPWLPEKEKGM